MGKLKVALLGIADEGQDYLAAILKDSLFEVLAISDRDANLLRDVSTSSGVRGFEDNRSLIVELSREELDAIFVAIEPHESYEFVQLAAQSKVAVFHKAPFARNISEARSLVDSFHAAGRSLVIARRWLADSSWSLSSAIGEEVGQVQLAMAEVAYEGGTADWRGDSERAGGGVLLHGAYAELDMLISVMGIPEEVFAQCAMFGQAGDVHNYDTEDMVTLSLRFSSQQTATLTAYRNAAISRSCIRWIGSDGVVETSADTFSVESKKRAASENESNFTIPASVEKDVHEFGLAIGGGLQPVSTGEDHLATMAVLEAAYLSTRTGAPESVGRFLVAD